MTDTPWARQKSSAGIPDPLTVDALSSLDGEDLTRMLRDHLLPAKPSGPEQRAWTKLWAMLGADDALADRAFDALDSLMSSAEDALAAGDGDDPKEHKRAVRFLQKCEHARNRLEGLTEEGPLMWAGRAADKFNRPGRKVIDILVMAIDRHRTDRSGSAPDQRLWAVLDEVGLDPRAFTGAGPFRGTQATQHPLLWAGRAGRGFLSEGRRVIEILVLAIDRHRSDTSDKASADRRLWAVLDEVGLDPQAFRRQVAG